MGSTLSMFNLDPIAWAVFGASGMLAGLAGLLVAVTSRRGIVRFAPGATGLLALLGVLAWATAQPAWLWQPLLALAGLQGGSLCSACRVGGRASAGRPCIPPPCS